MEQKRSQLVVNIREFDPKKDSAMVEEVERSCEVGPSGKMSLFTDLLGDPLCRIRNSPSSLMLVAEIINIHHHHHNQIVGMIRGCIKTVTCGKKLIRNSNNGSSSSISPVFTKLAYILGLRVSPSHRRMGIGLKLVHQMEQWFIQNGAEYSYMATENDNEASLNLFTRKCSYSKFRTPSILVQPVFAHRVKLSPRVAIIKLSPADSEALYRCRFSTTEFFPRDVDRILNHKLSLGTFVAVPAGASDDDTWPGVEAFLASPPDSWAVTSVWNSKEVFTLEVKGASLTRRLAVKTTRVADRAFPWLRIPSVPDFFKPFGLHFLYGLGGEGPRAGMMVKALCGHAHNLALKMGCEAVATEVASQDPLSLAVPHWKRLSCAEDVWCIKRLVDDYSDGSVGDWTKSRPGLSIFVDPREV